MRTITRRAPVALAALAVAVALPAPAPAAPAVAPDEGGRFDEVRITELGGTEARFGPVDVNLRGQVLGLTYPVVSVFDRGRLTPVSPPAPDARFQPYTAALNERGDVAGTSMYTSFPTIPVPANARPYLWSEGRHVDLGFGDGFVAQDVNDRRQVLLAAYPFGRLPDQVWDDGTMTPAPVPEGAFRATFVSLNDSGVAVGTVERFEGRRAAIWRVGGGITELGTLGGDHSWGTWITETGAVFGHSDTADGALRGFVWQNGRMRDLGTLGGPSTSIRRVSSLGDVVGESSTPDGERHGFLWRGGRMTDLGPILELDPRGVNVWGQVVGCSFDRTLQQQRLWLHQDGRRVDLTGLAGGIAASCDSVDINDRGQIVGAVTDPTRTDTRGVMWTVSPLWAHP